MKLFSRNLVLLIGFILAGCSPLVKSEQLQRPFEQSLQSGESIGQTFVARYDGLEGIALFLKPDKPGEGTLTLSLFHHSGETEPVSRASLPLDKIDSAGYRRFHFAPLVNSAGKDYYFQLELHGSGSLLVGTAPGETYLHGSLYLNQVPQDGQTSFRLVHDPAWMALGLIQTGISWLGFLAAGTFLLILPGWAILTWLVPGWRALSWGEKLGLSGGVSLAFYPLLFLWTDWAGMHLGWLYAWLPPMAAIAAGFWKVQVDQRRNQRDLRPNMPERTSLGITARPSRFSFPLSDLALAFILLLVFGVRFWALQELDAPLWGDSYQHTLMAQLMLDNRGLFQSWQPYTPYGSLTVQYGFSAAAALFAWLTRVDILAATLAAGQILNGLAVLAIYPFALLVTGGNRWAGVGAVLLAGLLSPMPAYFLNWGRYAQLAGLAILPVALWLFWIAVNHSIYRTRWKCLFLAAFSLSGMALAYYRMPFFYAAFAAAWLAGWALPHWRLDPHCWKKAALATGLVAIMAGLLILPWLPRLAGSQLAEAVEGGITVGSPVRDTLADFRAWDEILLYTPPALLALGLAGFLLSLLQKRWMLSALVLWVVLLTAYIAGRLIRLPGANMMQNFAVLIALYIPLSVLGGWLLSHAIQVVERRAGPAGRAAVLLAVLGLAVYGAWSQRSIARPDQYALVTRPDLRAAAWIEANTPTDARFLVQGFPIYYGTSVVGADGGWWLSLLANRQNTMPPQYALMDERPIQTAYSQQVIDLVKHLGSSSPASPQGIRLLCEQGITHLYIGQVHGKVGVGAVQLYSSEELAGRPEFSLVYQQDRVYIYAFDRQVCGPVE